MDQEHMEFPVFASFLSRHAESRRSRHAISSSLLRTVPACFVIGDGVGGGTLQHRSVRGGVRATAAIGRRQGRCLHRGTHVGSRRGAEGYGGQRWSHRGRLTRERERELVGVGVGGVGVCGSVCRNGHVGSRTSSRAEEFFFIRN